MQMKNYFKALTIILCLSLIVLRVKAQTLNINQFGVEEGLPQSGIHTMVHDKSGNIWIGTMAGISKYNGLTFENFDKKSGLSENRVTSSYIDKNGNIWFGHWSGGITKYSPVNKKFHEVTPGGIELKKTINSIFEDKSGNIWMGINGGGLLKYEPSAAELKGDTVKESGRFSLITKKEGLSSDFVTSIIQDKSGIIWVGTDAGITKINSDNKFDYYNESNGLPASSITCLMIDHASNIWIGSSSKGIFRLNASDDSLKVYNSEDGLASDYAKIIFEDGQNNIFIGTFGGGVSKYLPALELNNYVGPIFQTISTYQGLSNDKVLSIIQDREKNIWIGTYLNLNQYFDEQFEIYGEQEGLVNSLVWSVIQDRKGNFWIGTEGGLVKFNQGSNPNENKFEYFNDNKSQITNTTALYEDMEGNIWYTNFSNGLSKLNPETRVVETFTTKDSLPSNEIYGIADDRDGNIWIGTNNGGAVKYDIKTKKFEVFNKDKGLGSNQVYTIYKDSRQNLWFGVLGGDLTMYDGQEFKKFTDKDGYDSRFTVCITEDTQGNMWFGTYGKGIYKYDGKTFKKYTTREGATSDSPYLLAYDNNNNLWIGTGLGIDKFNLKEEKFKHYDRQDGFLGVEINPNAVCKDKDGNLWFGTIIGLVKYTSKREKNNLVAPVTTLKNPRVFYNEVEIPADHVFSYFNNHLTFDFIGASLTNPKRVRYKYMLDGFDKDWSPAIKQNYVTYPDIRPGKYTFKVLSCNNDGVWNEEPATFSFSVAPPFWQTWWFYSLIAIVLAVVTYSYVVYRERTLRRENKVLEDKVVVRTQQLSQEKKKSDDLLLNILPESTAEELKTKGKAAPRHYSLATVLFTDFKGFTTIAEKLSPEELINELDVCFMGFDDIIGRHNVEKIKTIGDAYMCVGGIPIRNKGNPILVTLAAIEIIDFMASLREEKVAKGQPYWELRLGIHSGPIIAGVVGKKKFAYDVWGDTVNTASRMESSGEPSKINVSGTTYELIKEYFECSYRGKIAAKNKGNIDMHFVDRIKPMYSADEQGRKPNDLFKSIIEQF